tara:strand:+ start:27712 stop:28596 length:885 start_codon:yes stop_codon:yes gene_type:complete
LRDAFVESIIEQGDNRNLYFITADLGFGSFDLLEKKLGKRYINIGVCEQNMINVSSGICLSDKKNKVIVYSIGNFPTLRCLEQIRNNICYHKLKVLIVSNGSGFSYGQLGMSHHSTEDFGIMRSLPEIEIYTPCNSNDAYNLTKNWIHCDTNKPTYLRLDKSEFNDASINDIKNEVDYRIISSKFSRKKNILEIYFGGISSILNDSEIKNDCCLIYRVRKGISQNLVELLSKYKDIHVYEEHNEDCGFGQYIICHSIKLKDKQNITVKCIPNIYPSFVGDQKYMRNQLGIKKND